MARENNFLIGHGERLAYEVAVPAGGSPKNLPYDWASQRNRLDGKISETYEYIRDLPATACPNDRSVALVTMHPRFISKSDFPESLLRSVGLYPIGSRPVEISPDSWGVIRHPESAVTDQIFVSGTRASFARWAATIGALSERSSHSNSLRTIENVSAFRAVSKIRSVPNDRQIVMLEVVLHNDEDEDVVRSFVAHAGDAQAVVYTEKRRDVGGLTFLPVEVGIPHVVDVATHSFVRVARGMPSLRPLRPLRPGVVRSNDTADSFSLVFADGSPTSQSSEAVIFDGGIPDHAKPVLAPWVSFTEPQGIGPPDPVYEAHGLGVTSAFMFGQLSPGRILEGPQVRIDHVRVLDQYTGANNPLNFEIFEVADRITSHLDQNGGRYRYFNLSIGPDMPVSDDEVSYWTAALDQRFVNAEFVPAIAVGNSGEFDAASGLNRVQPPSDAVNALSIGATDRMDYPWKKADYSSVGPGREPGLVKPDGVAFGGSASNPFYVIGANNLPEPVCGTSFATPLALKTAAEVGARIDYDDLNPLATRALMIHRADDDGNSRSEVGWGRFELDPELLITCPDDEATVIFRGTLPVGTHLRIPIPMPSSPMTGKVGITATILIAPTTNPEFAAAYTQSGFEAIFRPDSRRFRVYEGGRTSRHPMSTPFFSENAMYGTGEFELREGGLKWEPCVKRTRWFQSGSLSDPVFDIYNHSRRGWSRFGANDQVPYALIVSVKAPKVPDLYNQILRTYSGVLTPITPKLRVQIAPTTQIP